MFLDKFRPLDEISLPIGLDEILAHTLYIIDDDQLDVLLLHSLREVKEYFIVVLDVFAEVHYYILTHSGLSNGGLVLNQKIIFHLIEPLFVQVFPRYHKKCFSPEAPLLLREY